MNWHANAQRNLEALKRILASLVAMAKWTELTDAGVPTLPRFLHRRIVRLLGPAEATARRLIIVAARGLVVTLPQPRKARPNTVATQPILRSLGIAIVMSTAEIARAAAATRAAALRAARPRTLCLPLFDPLRRPFRERRRCVPAHAGPCISTPGIGARFALPSPPSPEDPISARRVTLRLQALSAALDDLPRHALRFARWKARVAMAAQNGSRDRTRPRRTRALRRGKPPGCRLKRWDPTARRGKHIRDIDEILAQAHDMALFALEQPDTS